MGWILSVVVASGFARWYRRRLCIRRRAAAELDEVVALVDEVIRQVRSGASLSAGFLAAGSRHRVVGMETVEASMAAGCRLAPSLDRLADAAPGTPLALTAVAINVLAAAGFGTSAGLERLAETLRSQRAAALDRRTQSAQASFSALVLGVLPVLATVTLVIGSSAARAVYASTFGSWCVAGMVILTVLGQVWMDAAIWGRTAAVNR